MPVRFYCHKPVPLMFIQPAHQQIDLLVNFIIRRFSCPLTVRTQADMYF
jgi:hypothetical protein